MHVSSHLGSTVFVYQASNFSYIYSYIAQQRIQTAQAKQAFEAGTKKHGVTVKHYHAANDLFCTENFMQDLEKHDQTISLAGFGAHHQNGTAEKQIGYLQKKATTVLLYVEDR